MRLAQQGKREALWHRNRQGSRAQRRRPPKPCQQPGRVGSHKGRVERHRDAIARRRSAA